MLHRWRNSVQQSSNVRCYQCVLSPVSPVSPSRPFALSDVKIIDQLGPERPPQVTFSCSKEPSSEFSLGSQAAPDANNMTCSFQFWTAEVESFYCGLEQCKSSRTPVSSLFGGSEDSLIQYECEKLKCSCIPGRFICGEDGSVGKLPCMLE